MSTLATEARLRPRVQLSRVWSDDDLLEIAVVASSEHFAGQTSLYARHADASDLAAVLDGFPSGCSNRRPFELGQTDLIGYGNVRGTFYCVDTKGQLALRLEISRNASNAAELSESCELLIRLRPADLDNFVSELREFGTAGRVTASLAPSA